MVIKSNYKEFYDKFQDWNDETVYHRFEQSIKGPETWEMSEFREALNRCRSIGVGLFGDDPRYSRQNKVGLLVFPHFILPVCTLDAVKTDSKGKRDWTISLRRLSFCLDVVRSTLAYKGKKPPVDKWVWSWEGSKIIEKDVASLHRLVRAIDPKVIQLHRQLYDECQTISPIFYVEGYHDTSIIQNPPLSTIDHWHVSWWHDLYMKIDNFLKNDMHPENLVKLNPSSNDVRVQAAGFGPGSFITNQGKKKRGKKKNV